MGLDVLGLEATISVNTSGYTQGLQQAANSTQSFGGKIMNGMKAIGNVTMQVAKVATKAVVGFAKSSLEAGQSFDASMSQVAATMGYTADELNDSTSKASQNMQKLRDFAQEMGSTTAFSASQAADALNYMALAGYDAETSMKMLPNVLNLAAAGSMDLATASDMVTDAQTALGLSLEETEEMVDIMAKTSSSTNTSVSQLGDAFLTIGATARNVKGGTEELANLLGVLADNGIKGSEGGTKLRNMIMSLQNPTKNGAAALEQLGVSVYDAEGNMRSMIDIIEDMQAGMVGMTQSERDSLINNIFNKQDAAAVNALLGTTTDRFAELSEKIGDATGAAEAMAKTQLDNLAGDVTLFKSALEGAKIAISDGITPVLRKFVKFGSDGLSRLTDAFKEGGFKGAMKEFGKILSDGIAMLIEMMPEMIEAGMEMIGSLVEGLIDNAPLLIDAAIDIVTMLADYLIEELPILIPAIVDMILTIVDKLTEPDTLMMLLDAAIAIIIALAEGLMNALPKLIEKAPKIIENLVQAIVEATPKLINAAIKILVVLVAGIVENLDKLIEAGMEIVGSIIVGIVEWLGKLVMIGADIGNSIKEGFWDFIEGAKQWGSDLIQNFIAGITQKWADLKDKVKGVAGMVKDYLGFSEPEKGPLSDFHTYAPDMMQLFAKGITDNAKLITDAIGNTFNLEPAIKAETSQSTGNVAVAGGFGGDIVIPVYIGQDRIDEMIIRANKVNDYLTGGRG